MISFIFSSLLVDLVLLSRMGVCNNTAEPSCFTCCLYCLKDTQIGAYSRHNSLQSKQIKHLSFKSKHCWSAVIEKDRNSEQAKKLLLTQKINKIYAYKFIHSGFSDFAQDSTSTWCLVSTNESTEYNWFHKHIECKQLLCKESTTSKSQFQFIVVREQYIGKRC